MSAPTIYLPLDHTQATPLLLYREGRVLLGFPKHPRKFQAEVLAMVLSYLNSMYVFYIMYADFPSGGFSIRPS